MFPPESLASRSEIMLQSAFFSFEKHLRMIKSGAVAVDSVGRKEAAKCRVMLSFSHRTFLRPLI